MGGAYSSMREMRGVHRVLVGKPEGMRPLGRTERRWRMLLRWIFKEGGWGAWNGLIWLRIGTVAGTCTRGNELWMFHINGGNF